MHLSTKLWSCLSYVANILTLQSFDRSPNQHPIGGHVKPVAEPYVGGEPNFPIFKPPGGRLQWDGSEFVCNYSRMPDYEFCGHETNNRGCWLRPKDRSSNKHTYNISTDYENIAPKGIDRNYEFTIKDGWVNADGYNFTKAKLVNDIYPGPWVQACWGDRVIVKVNNKLQFNGTAIHWHGIRQHKSMEMDGVPGITQCPIAPNDTFTYDFSAKQYGSAWYHSHYSVQYADGMLGPLTIHGPHSASFDEPKPPLLITDWFHNSAFQVIHRKTPGYPTILLNGTGNINRYKYATLEKDRNLTAVKNNSAIPPQYRLHFNKTLERPGHPNNGKRPPRYLLSLMNTAFDTTFVFSIDHHELEVISADFVPIEPYNTTHLHIGIGQRYNVVVRGKPVPYPNNSYGGENRDDFWIRTTAAPCFGADDKLASLQGYDKTGVLTYTSYGDDDPMVPLKPDTERWAGVPALPKCQDEDSFKMKPVHKWTIGPATNGYFNSTHRNGTVEKLPGERLDIVGSFMFNDTDPLKPGFDNKFPLATFSIEREKNHYAFAPMQINYNDPLFLHLNDSAMEVKQWPKKWAVIQENHANDKWIYLAIGGRHINKDKKKHQNEGITGGAHPMHLHGHDFAILQQAYNMTMNATNWNLTLNNPPRRDVVLLPEDGFIVIAFKVDNPGSWIMHCHIAFHASEGLALQIMENKDAANALWPKSGKAVAETNRVCKEWKKFESDCTKHSPGYDSNFKCWPACNNKDPSKACPNLFQDDSGV